MGMFLQIAAGIILLLGIIAGARWCYLNVWKD